MSIKITTCPECNSDNIYELNPENRDISSQPLCKITCKCLQCNEIFIIPSWTKNGKRRGILY
jgi:RNase P subunit RPR2